MTAKTAPRATAWTVSSATFSDSARDVGLEGRGLAHRGGEPKSVSARVGQRLAGALQEVVGLDGALVGGRPGSGCSPPLRGAAGLSGQMRAPSCRSASQARACVPTSARPAALRCCQAPKLRPPSPTGVVGEPALAEGVVGHDGGVFLSRLPKTGGRRPGSRPSRSLPRFAARPGGGGGGNRCPDGEHDELERHDGSRLPRALVRTCRRSALPTSFKPLALESALSARDQEGEKRPSAPYDPQTPPALPSRATVTRQRKAFAATPSTTRWS